MPAKVDSAIGTDQSSRIQNAGRSAAIATAAKEITQTPLKTTRPSTWPRPQKLAKRSPTP